MPERLAAQDVTAPPLVRPAGVRRYTICSDSHCGRGAHELYLAMRRVSRRLGLDVSVERTMSMCPGTCTDGPFIGMPELGLFYSGLQRGDVPLLLNETSVAGRLVFERLHLEPTEVIDHRLIYQWKERVLVAVEPGFCPVGLIHYLFAFNAAESCGKCFPCRHGVQRMHHRLTKLMTGGAKEADLKALRDAARAMSRGAYCDFAVKVSTPVLMGLEFKGEAFAAHLDGGCEPGEMRL